MTVIDIMIVIQLLDKIWNICQTHRNDSAESRDLVRISSYPYKHQHARLPRTKNISDGLQRPVSLPTQEMRACASATTTTIQKDKRSFAGPPSRG
jgi:hypothetical protein